MTGPRGVDSSIRVMRTDESPIGLGRKGERVAKTPMRRFPPRRGGRTVGDHSWRWASEKSHNSQICEKPSNPRNDSTFRKSGSKTMRLSTASISPLWRGTPNFVSKSFSMCAITVIRLQMYKKNYELRNFLSRKVTDVRPMWTDCRHSQNWHADCLIMGRKH